MGHGLLLPVMGLMFAAWNIYTDGWFDPNISFAD